MVLKEETGSVSASAHNQYLLSGLVVAQIALSLALLITAGLFLRTLKKASEADLGFDRTHVLLASVDLRTSGYSGSDARAFHRRLLAKLAQLPGVTSAALSDWVPLTLTRGSTNAFPEGYVAKLHESLEVRNTSVTAEYFQTMSIPIAEGREFTERDDENAPMVAIVDETMAHHFWPWQYAVGKRMRVYGNWVTVVGVERNSSHLRMNETPEPIVYLSYFQFAGPQAIFHLRTRGDPELSAPAVEGAVHEINRKLPV